MDKIDYLRVPSLQDVLQKGTMRQDGRGLAKSEVTSKIIGRHDMPGRANSKHDVLHKRPDVKILFLGAKNVGKTGL